MKLKPTLHQAALFCLLAVVLMPASSLGQADATKQKMAESGANRKSKTTEESCREFVQQFYNWYVHKADTNRALKFNGGTHFSANLAKQLKLDEAESKKNPNEVTGLDFDPFLNAQDLPGAYEATKVTPKGSNYIVDVYGLEGGKKPARVTVMPELTFRNGNWVFINFHYFDESSPKKVDDLLSILKSLREERAKQK